MFVVARNVPVETGGRENLLAATRQSQSDEKRRAGQVAYEVSIERIGTRTRDSRELVERFSEHWGVFGRIRAAVSFGERDAQNKRFRHWLIVLLRPEFQQVLFKSCIYSSLQLTSKIQTVKYWHCICRTLLVKCNKC